jgi:ABC-2 type transport system ATP-binding protein
MKFEFSSQPFACCFIFAYSQNLFEKRLFGRAMVAIGLVTHVKSERNAARMALMLADELHLPPACSTKLTLYFNNIVARNAGWRHDYLQKMLRKFFDRFNNLHMSKNIPLKIQNVGKVFDPRKPNAKRVLNDVSFEVEKGEIFGLIGLNGVGKTTLIKIVLDLLKAGEGSAEIFGIDSKDFNARKKLAYLPEKFVPSQLLKGKEFLDLSLSYYDVKLDMTKAEEGAVKLGLDPAVLKNRVGKYSKGMSQKLGLLGTFLTEAPLLVLDEPMSGLDPRARVQLKDYLLNYRGKKNTIFFSSHILGDIDEICDRIGVIHDAELKFIGTPKEMKKKYKEEILERAFLKCIEK